MEKIWLLILMIPIFIACSDDNNNGDTSCGTPLVIDGDRYQDITQPFNAFFIISSNIDDDCLTLTIGFSGCDDNHEIDLVTDGAVAESFPVQIFFKLDDLNPQLCEAYFEKEYQYDLDELDQLLGNEPKARLIFPQTGHEILWERN